MAKRKLTPAQELREHVNRLAERHARWERERCDGCVDPNWSDGDNLNLVRNHIIYYKQQIRLTCNKFSLTIPAIYYRPLPPEMPHDFFSTGKNYNPQRIARILNLRGLSDKKKTEEEKSKSVPVQLTLF